MISSRFLFLLLRIISNYRFLRSRLQARLVSLMIPAAYFIEALKESDNKTETPKLLDNHLRKSTFEISLCEQCVIDREGDEVCFFLSLFHRLNFREGGPEGGPVKEENLSVSIFPAWFISHW
jgi:hypothetical protein